MTTFKFISDLFESANSQEISPNDPEFSALTVLIRRLDSESINRQAEVSLLQPFLLSFLTTDSFLELKKAELISYFNILISSNYVSPLESIISFDKLNVDKLLQNLISVIYRCPIDEANILALQFLYILPAEIQLLIIKTSAIPELFKKIHLEYQKWDLTIAKPNRDEASPNFELMTQFLATNTNTLSRIIYEQWDLINLHMEADYREASTEIIGLFLSRFLTSEELFKHISPSPFASTIGMIDSLLAKYMSISTYGLGIIPTCIIGSPAPFDTSLNSLLSRILPKVIPSFYDILNIVTNEIQTSNPHQAYKAKPSMKFSSIWDFSDDIVTKPIPNDMHELHFLEIWALRATLLSAFASGIWEFKTSSNPLEKLIGKISIVLEYIKISLESNFDYLNAHLYSRVLLCDYILRKRFSQKLRSNEMALECMNLINEYSNKCFKNYEVNKATISPISRQFMIHAYTELFAQAFSLNGSVNEGQSSFPSIFWDQKALSIITSAQQTILKLIALSDPNMPHFKLFVSSYFKIESTSNISKSLSLTTLSNLFGATSGTNTKSSRKSKFNVLSCMPSSAHDLSFKRFEQKLKALSPNAPSSTSSPKNVTDVLKMKYVESTKLNPYTMNSLSSLSYALIISSFIGKTIEPLNSFCEKLMGYNEKSGRFSIDEDITSSFYWLLVNMTMTFHPKFIATVESIPSFNSLSGEQMLHYHNKMTNLIDKNFVEKGLKHLNWIKQATLIANFIWQTIQNFSTEGPTQVVSTVALINILYGISLMFSELSNETDGVSLCEEALGEFLTLLTSIILVITDRSSVHDLILQPKYWSLTTSLSFIFNNLRHNIPTINKIYLESIEENFSLLNHLYYTYKTIADPSQSNGNSTYSSSMPGLPFYFTQLALNTSQGHISHIDDFNRYIPHPSFVSYGTSNWENTTLLDRLTGSLLYERPKTELIRHKQILNQLPIMFILSHNSCFINNGALVKISVELNNMTDLYINDLYIEMHINEDLGAIFSSNFDNKYSPQKKEMIEDKDAGYSSELIGKSRLSITNLSPKARDNCQFFIQVNHLKPIELSFSVSFGNNSKFLEYGYTFDENESKDSKISSQSNRKYIKMKRALMARDQMHDDNIDNQFDIQLQSINSNLPLSTFFKPYYGFGSYLDINSPFSSKLLQHQTIKEHENLILSWIYQGLSTKKEVMISYNLIAAWEPSCFNKIISTKLLKVLVASLFNNNGLVMILIRLPPDIDSTNDLTYLKSKTLVEIYCSSEELSHAFASKIEFWIHHSD